MVSGGSGSHSTAIDDLPGLVSRVAQDEGDRTALEFGGESVSYGALHQELTNLDTAMGGVLGADALVPLALSTVAPGAIESVAGGLESIVADVVADARAVLGDFVLAAPAASAETLPGRFRAQVQRTPDAEALRFEGLSLTYAEFDARVNTLARRLVDLGVGPDTAVGLSISRSVELLVAMYAIVEAGGAYVPLDPAHPADRISYVLDIARPLLVLTTTAENTALPSGTSILYVDTEDLSGLSPLPMSDDERMRPLEPENTAYVIFTSGSTGRPKGVAVSHEAIVANLDWRQRDYPLTEADVVLQKTPFTFDVSVWEFFWPLQAGATLVIAAPDGHRDPAYIADAMARQGVTTAHFVPSMLAVFLGLFDSVATPSIPSLRQVFASGEALPAAAARRFHEVLDADLHNLYGPTEAAVDVTYHRTDDSDGVSVPIGVAVPRTELHVLDEGLGRTPPGVPGELYLAGVQLARGYMARPDLTADRFVADPAGDGTRMYRTGDLVRWNSDGVLEYLGRTDFQVKLRGLRIELGEIEAALVAQDDVRQAVVVVVSDDSDSGVYDRLVAYVVTVSGSVDPDALSAGLRGRLPDYMVPAVFVGLDELPLNASGKLDRRALPKPDASVSAAEYRAPETDTERAVVRVFEDILGAERVGVDDDFFALGGNSLSATRAIARVNADLKVGVDVRGFFDAPTAAGLSALVDTSRASGAVVREPLTRQPRPDVIPLSLAQQRMWFLNRLDPESAVNNIPVAVRLTGDLDVAALRSAVGDLVLRHEVLRTSYPEVSGVGRQVVSDDNRPELEVESVEADDLYSRVLAVVTRGFDVTAEVPVRLRLMRIDERDHVLVVVAHHIAADGFSMGPLTRDVITAYAARSVGQAPAWTPLEVQYADFALWQRSVLGSETDPDSLIFTQEQFWRDKLTNLPEQLELPTDRRRPSIATGRGATFSTVIASELRTRIDRIAGQFAVTPFMVVHAALAVLLSRLSGSRDIAIGTPVAGRGEQILDPLIGMFVNTLVLRTDVVGADSFSDFLAAVRRTDIDAFGNSDVPFERLVEVLDPPRSRARHPLFQVMLVFQNVDSTTLELPGLTVEGVEFDAAVAKMDLQVTISEKENSPGGAWSLDFTYALDLFDELTVQLFAQRLNTLLHNVVRKPESIIGEIDVLSAAERHEVLQKRNDTAQYVPDALLLSDFHRVATDNAGAPALGFEGDSLTYGAFSERVTKLARYLVGRGVGPDSSVAVAVRRSFDLLVALYAVVEAGAAYVPIDPDQPRDRNRYILDTSGSKIALTTTSDAFEEPSVDVVAVDSVDLSTYSSGPLTDAERSRPLRPQDIAYVLFTSGSTGRPKGVAVSHASIVNRLFWMQSQYDLTVSDVVVQKTPMTFDVSVWEFFWPLMIGARLEIAKPEGHRDPQYLADLIAARSVTVAHFVPSMLSFFLSEATIADRGSLRLVFASGEALPTSTARNMLAKLAGVRLVNLYGPTEAAVDVTYHEVLEVDAGTIPIGRAVYNTKTFVLDSRLHPVLPGVVGELYLAGVQLARGYYGRPDLTADRFVADLLGGSGGRLYRTGDLVRWNHAGELEYIGRSDFQVKLRGLRIELGEVESVIEHLESVRDAVVLVRQDRLVAYVVTTEGASITADELRAATSRELPTYMVPDAVVRLDALPLSSAGKLDRKALPDPHFEVRSYRAPTTPVEQIVASVIGEVLGIERVGVDDDFFALGGNSLMATQVASRLGAALDATVPVRLLFEVSSVESLAIRIESSGGAASRIPLEPRERPARIPLSMAQQRMWFLNRLEPESAVNNIPVALRLSGSLDGVALRAAISDLLDRHETLRTVYPEIDGVGYQEVRPTQSVVPDLTPVSVDEAQLVPSIENIVLTGFDVTDRVPFRASLFRLSPTEHVLVFVVHHIAADGFSLGPLTRDVVQAYNSRVAGLEPNWAPLTVQYADFTLWQREVLGSENEPDSVISTQEAYWRRTLDGLPEQLDLPFDRPRPTVASNRGATHRFVMSAAQRAAVEELATRERATPFMVVHAAIAVLLARLSGTDDVAVGAPIAGRGEAALDDMIGMFVNTLVLRTRVESQTRFDDVLGRVKEGDLSAFANADLPFERLVEMLDPARSTARHPLFQVALFFQNLGVTELELPELAVSAVEFDIGTAKFDLQIAVSEMADGTGWSIEFIYATDLFDASGVELIGDRLMRVLDAVTEDPSVVIGDIALTSAEERLRLTRSWNATEHEVNSVLLLDRFDAAVAAYPESTALVYEDDSLTYRELSSRVDAVATSLVTAGAGAETLVALAMRRSIDLVVGMYAVLRTGAGFVPIDPDHPAERVGYILDAADPVCVLTRSEDGFAAPGNVDVIDVHADPTTATTVDLRERQLSPDSVAYVIFTSGSTGKPKGVAVGHRAIVNQMEWMQSEYGIADRDVYLQKTATTFDVSLWGFFLPLRVGATLVLATPDGHRDPSYLADLIARRSVTVTDFVPTMLSVFAGAVTRKSIETLEQVFVIGEALPGEAVRDFARVSNARVHNLYGPTEAAVSITYADVTDTAAGSAVTIGRPEWNSSVYVLDSRLTAVPPGVPGELYLAGVQLARGYYGRVDLTADRFVANPFASGSAAAGSRMYRTGDLVTQRPDGRIDYIGRTDFQVKFRGQRIELGEIETALTGQAAVAMSAVAVVPTASGDQLVAYVVPVASSNDIDVAELRAALAETLPRYMIPSAFVTLAEFPLNTSGKLDRKALPVPEFETAVFRAPSNPVEETVANIFAEVLGIERVGLDDDFFALGGNSLIATQLVSRIGAALESRVPLRDLFEAPTVEALAARAQSHTGGRVELVAMQRPDRIPLSLAQQRMWFLNRLDPASAVNNIPAAVRLSGTLDRSALEAAIGDVVARHEILRTVYPETAGAGIQVILPANAAHTDFAAQTVDEGDVHAAVVELVTRGFDVTRSTPVRVRLLEVGAGEHVLVVVAHHIAADGFSMVPLLRDIVTAYVARAGGDGPNWAPLPVQYADYTLWQRDVLGSSDDSGSLIAIQEAFWKETLSDHPDELVLPTDRPRPPAASGRGASLTRVLDERTTEAIDSLAAERGVTSFMVVHAAVAVLLSRLSGSADVSVGTPVAGRGEAALDDVIGMFVNTLVLRTSVDGSSTFDEVLAGVREVDLAAFAHADVPFERVVEVVDPPRVQGLHPLVQVLLTFQNYGKTSFELPGLTASAVDFDAAVAKMDLQITVTEPHEQSDGRHSRTIEFIYATDLYDSSTVEVMAEQFLAVLSNAVMLPATAVGDIDIVGSAVRERLLTQWSSSGLDVHVGGATLVDRFDSTVAAFPQSVALRYADTSLTYAELDARVNRLARRLIDTGAGPDSLVAVALPRSADLVVALLAVIKSGAGYLPVDPSYPRERVDFMLADAAPIAAVTTTEVLSGESAAAIRAAAVPILDVAQDDSSRSPSRVTDEDRVAPLRGDNLAYVIYTSGSTGRPKGVQIPHHTVLRLIDNTDSFFGFDQTDVWTMFHSYAFDFSVWELWGPLLHGGTVVMVDYFTARSPEAFRELLVREGVTVLNQTPSAFYQLAESDREQQPQDANALALRFVIFGGEALEPRRLTGWFDRHGDGSTSGPLLVNMYGITETTVHVSLRALSAASVGSASVIGAPISGLGIYVLDNRLLPVPVGVAGELYVSGGQLARGYLGRADLSAARFIANPFGDGRLYRTGDVARWGHSESGGGDLIYLGRSDDQVKVRGFRIELGEIEAAVSAQDGVSATAVIVREDSPGAQRLVAYVVGTADVNALRAGVAELVPEYMVPSAFVAVDEIPLTVNGKLDRKALPEPNFEGREFREPASNTERVVAQVFADVLGVDEVGRDDDFFELGGNSLIATQVASRVGAALDATVPVRVVFDSSTVEAFAVAIGELVGGGSRPALVASDRPERIPLSLAQQRMWVLNNLDPQSGSYNIPLAVRLTGDLNVSALERAVADVVARHESLRSLYPSDDDGPHQKILPAAEVTFDLTPRTVEDDPGAIAAIAEFVSGGFDVSSEVPVRVALFELSPGDHVLALVVHHISADGASIAPLARDVVVAYAARTNDSVPEWSDLPVQYADYAIWQREVLGTVDDAQSLASEQLRFWTENLAGSPDAIELPTDRPSPLAPSMEGRSVSFEVGIDSHTALVEFARDRGTSLFMLIHAAVAVLLSRLSDNNDIVIGTPVAGRGAAELDDLVGMFVNTLALRTEVDLGGTYSGLVDKVRSTDLNAFSHADVPFEDVVDAVLPARSQARHPIFQVALSFQNNERVRLDLPGLTVEGLDAGELGAKFDLQFTIEERLDEKANPVGLSGSLLYAVDLFDEVTARSFADRLTRIVDAVAENPYVVVGDIEIRTELEREQVDGRARIDAPQLATIGDRSLAQLIASAVETDPDAPAFAVSGQEMSFLMAESRSARLARVLIDAGVEPGEHVVIALPVSVEWAVAVWAVSLAGGAIVVGDRGNDVSTLVDISRAQIVVGTREIDVPLGVRLIAVDSDETTAAVAQASPRPIDYSARTRVLGANDSAVLLVKRDGDTVRRTNADVVASLTRTGTNLGVTYESRVAAEVAVGDAWQLLAVLTAAIVGACWVAPVGVDTEVGKPVFAELLADEWVTHAFVVEADAPALDADDLEDLEALIIVDSDEPQSTVGDSQRVSISRESEPFGAV
ncbi:MAG: amino acid adenylation domain-containing protein [Rhodococcus sp. (in: high G+C Gram-positive bacteria)]|nr:non-ribosomal peptide synthetase [Rhodococcus sp. (in: high G+C Gram-positive bacteria)]MDI6626237.1 amino acid adenylation domain-containing protein [Rhodococcus sp. (in: high G+C Gram-positive bacteria)]